MTAIFPLPLPISQNNPTIHVHQLYLSLLSSVTLTGVITVSFFALSISIQVPSSPTMAPPSLHNSRASPISITAPTISPKSLGTWWMSSSATPLLSEEHYHFDLPKSSAHDQTPNNGWLDLVETNADGAESAKLISHNVWKEGR